MGWKSVAWAGCLVPVLAGCGMLRHAPLAPLAPTAPVEIGPSPTWRGIERDQRHAANDVWQAVCAKHADRGLSREFRDGFLDGYTDYLERGTGAQPPAVPPNNVAGPGPVRDYYLGFGYGCEVAGAHRPLGAAHGPNRMNPPAAPFQITPDPAPRPRPVPGSDTDPDPKKPGVEPLKPPEGSEREAVPPLPKPELPIIKPFNPALLVNPSLPGDLKFHPLLPDPDKLPAPDTPLPVEPSIGPLTPPEASKVPTRPWFLEPPPVIPPLPLVSPAGASTPQK